MHGKSPAPVAGPARTPLLIREASLTLLEGVCNHRMLSDTVRRLGPLADLDRSRALFLAETVLRRQGRIDQVLDGLIEKRPHRRGLNVLRLAVAELRALDAVPELTVDQAVRLMHANRKTRHLAGLANAVLRKAAGDAGERLWRAAQPGQLPDWIGRPVAAAFGADARLAIEAAHETTPPLDLTPASTLAAERLRIELDAILLPSGSLRLRQRARVSALAGYGAGDWWVQDAAAVIPVRLLGPLEGQDVLDMCAAPGGKTLQLAAAGARVAAIDISERRLARVRANLERTGLPARLECADALAWNPRRQFDAVVVDAPCTSTGTIRRNPDLPFIRGGGDGPDAGLAARQRALLARAAELTRSGGRILYSVCSLLPSEGEEMAASAARELDLRILPADCRALGLDPGWRVAAGGIRTRPDYWPELGGMDGFYAAVLVKP